MDRRTFLKNSSRIASAGAIGGLVGCSGDDLPAPASDVGGAAETGAAGASASPAAAASHPDLLGSYWTIAGDVSPATGGREWSLFDFRDRAEALARGGFRGMGIWHTDMQHALETYSLADMKRILDDNGIEHLELEFLLNWFVEGEAREASDELRAQFLRWAEALDARHIKVGDFFNTEASLDQCTEAFAGLCADAAGVGTMVLFEMMPFAMVDDFDNSIKMCADAGAANGGVMMDTWHMFKMGVPMEKIADMPSEWLKGIELNDGWNETPEGLTLNEETTQERQFPGEGEFDMKAFVEACLATGYDGPWGVEVINVANRARSLEDLVDKAYTTTASMFV